MTLILRSLRAFAARFVLGSVTLIAAAAALMTTGAACAQGTSGQLPEPLSAQDLTRFLDRYVRPTAAQWDTIDTFHEQYKTEFKRLRDGEIEEFLEKSKKLQGTMPQRATVEEWTKDHSRLFAKIKTLDGRLFDQIQGNMEDEQVRAMPRVKLARERATYRNQMMMGMAGGMPADLSEVLAGLELGRSDFAPLDPTLISYESQLTRKLGELNDSTGNMIVTLFDALTAAGFGDVDNEQLMKDPEKMKAFMEVMQQAFKDATKKGRELSGDIAKLNHRTRKALMPLLPPDKVVRFRRDFVARAYPFFGAVDTGTDTTLKTAMRLKALTDDQRAALKQTLDAWMRDDERLENELMEAMDEVNLSRSPMDFGQTNKEDPAQQALEKLREKRLETAAAAVNNAKAIVGPDLAIKLDQPGGPGQDALLAEAGDAAPQGANQAEGELATPTVADGSVNGGDMFISAKISAPVIAVWSRRLELDDGQRAILDALHSDYLQQWQTNVDPRITAIGAASTAAYAQPNPTKQGDAEPQWVAPTEAALDALYAARLAAMQEVEKVEQAFLENVRLSVVDEAHKPVFELIALDRSLFTDVGSLGWATNLDGNREGQVNIAGVVAEALDDTDLATAAAIVIGHADALKTTTREVRRTTFENQRNAEKLGARMQAAMKDGDSAISAAVDVDYQKQIKVTQEQANAAGALRRDAVRKVLAELKEKLPPEEARKVERGYKRGAFPRAYADSRSAEPLIERARNLSDLTEQQTKDLAVLSEEFQPAYEQVADKMADLNRDAENPMGGDPDEWQKWQERQNKLARLRFERDEVSMKTVRKLKQLLTEEQVKRIPGLMAYAQKEREGPFGGAFGE